ncbi:MAG: B12-binding domain-containing radical SAM protein [Candidatus Lokiarchaeota archaeon]|nr:B12-binding domain-containing radical SAM protein [Candidatus Lokiarchaeota archaeon]
MNLLFIIPGFFNIEEYQEKIYNNNVPLGTLQISSFLKEKFQIKTDLIDIRIEKENNNYFSLKNNYDMIIKSYLKILDSNNIQKFQYIGINCYTSYQYLPTLIIGNLIRKEFPEKKIIVGGYHPSSYPDDFIYKNSPFDYIVKDEAELSLFNLLKKDNLNNREFQSPKIIEKCDLIDINLLPPPDYELYLSKYSNRDDFNFDLYLSRGCPYQCNFCSINYPFRTMHYSKFKENMDYMIRLFNKFKKDKIKISFADQSFFDNTNAESILDYIIQNDLQDKFKFSCQSRIESIANRHNILKKIQKSKLIIGFGFESANPNILIEMNKTKTPSQYIQSMKKIIEYYKKNNNIYCRINIVCGFPGETKRTFKKTAEFIQKNALDENIQISPSLFSCYPNTPVYRNMDYYIKKYGSLFNKMWWKSNSENLFKLSILKKSSKQYSIKDILLDYKNEYTRILNLFKHKNFSDLIIWKKFYSKWYYELCEEI